MNRFARFSILGVSILVFGWVGLGHVLGRTTDNKAYKSLVVYSEVLQKIQQDYVDEPNMHTVTAGSLHGLLESLDPQSSYLIGVVLPDAVEARVVSTAPPQRSQQEPGRKEAVLDNGPTVQVLYSSVRASW